MKKALSCSDFALRPSPSLLSVFHRPSTSVAPSSPKSLSIALHFTESEKTEMWFVLAFMFVLLQSAQGGGKSAVKTISCNHFILGAKGTQWPGPERIKIKENVKVVEQHLLTNSLMVTTTTIYITWGSILNSQSWIIFIWSLAFCHESCCTIEDE